MELTNLLSNLKKSQSDSKKYIALEVGPESVKSAIWEVAGTKPQIVQYGTVETFNSEDEEDLLQAIDASISKATETLETEPNEVIFSVPDSWIEQASINKQKKTLLKNISQKLELKALGFVVTLEAVVHFIQHKKGHPPSCIVIGVSSEDIVLSIVQNGRIEGSHTVGRSEDLGADVEEGIARFGSISNLPSNIILYDGHANLEELKQTLIAYNLQERLPFLHLPKIDILKSEEVISAIVETGGSEVITSLEVNSQSISSEADTDIQPSELDEVTELSQPPDLSADFGFGEQESDSLNLETESNLSPVSSEKLSQTSLEESEEQITQDASTSKNSRNIFSGLFKLLKRKPQTLSSSSNKKLPILFTVGLLIIIIFFLLSGLAYWYLPKAKVTIYIQPTSIDKNLTFTLDPNIQNIDLSNSVIPASPVETEVSANASIPATGEKLVGDAASGTITLYNRTDSTKTFTAGTRISSGNLAYTLDEDIQIASASTKENPDLSITTQPATIDVNITAIDIGAQYNLSLGTEFNVANFDKSSFLAKAKTEIGGGTSRQITAVSKDDIEKLTNIVNQDLNDQATNRVAQTPEDFISAVILPDQENNRVDDYSAQAGEEATEVTLSSTLKVNTMTYRNSDISTFIHSQTNDAIPQGYELAQLQSGIEPTDVEVNPDGSVKVSARAKIQIIPILNQEEIADHLKGKYPSVTENYFKSLQGFTKVEIDIKPQFPSQLRTFPRISNNISIEIKSTNE